jgi:hypothetical protein
MSNRRPMSKRIGAGAALALAVAMAAGPPGRPPPRRRWP